MRTVDDILTDILDELGPVDVPDLRQVVNRRVQELARMYEWRHYQSTADITVPKPYQDGTISIEEGGSIVTGTDTAWTSDHEGWRFKAAASPAVYTVEDVTDGTTLVLSRSWGFDALTDGAYMLFKPYHALPEDMARLIHIWDSDTQLPVVMTGYETLRRDMARGLLAEGRQGAMFGKDDQGRWQLYVQPANKDRVLRLDYYRTPQKAAGMTDTPDIAAHMEEALYMMVLGVYVNRLQPEEVRARRKMEHDRDMGIAIRNAERAEGRMYQGRYRNERTVM